MQITRNQTIDIHVDGFKRAVLTQQNGNHVLLHWYPTMRNGGEPVQARCETWEEAELRLQALLKAEQDYTEAERGLQVAHREIMQEIAGGNFKK